MANSVVATWGSPQVSQAIYGDTPEETPNLQGRKCCFISPHLLKELRTRHPIYGQRFAHTIEHTKQLHRNKNEQMQKMKQHYHDYLAHTLTADPHHHDGIIGKIFIPSEATTSVPKQPQAPTTPVIKVYDGKHAENPVVRGSKNLVDNNADTSQTKNVHLAFTTSQFSSKYWLEKNKQNSLDGKGMALIDVVNTGDRLSNAFFDGEKMCYGNGDGNIFGDFTFPKDIGFHEMTHCVTQNVFGDIVYQDEPGQLNESISDVFAIIQLQLLNGQAVPDALWKIGLGVLIKKNIAAQCLRDMAKPGTAYDNKYMGKDPQPANYGDLSKLTDPGNEDNGNVHVGSSIGNLAFYLICMGIYKADPVNGKFSYQKAGELWYKTLTDRTLVPPKCNWSQFAYATTTMAERLWGKGAEWQAVQAAWTQIQVPIKKVM